MEPPSTPEDGRGDVGGDAQMPEANSGVEQNNGGENEEKLDTKAAEPGEAVLEKTESLETTTTDATITKSIEDEDGTLKTAATTIETSATRSFEETEEEGDSLSNNIKNDEATSALPSSATPDSMAFSMGIYSMDDPPTTPLVASTTNEDLKTPMRASFSSPLEQPATTTPLEQAEKCPTAASVKKPATTTILPERNTTTPKPMPSLQFKTADIHSSTTDTRSISSMPLHFNSNTEESSNLSTLTAISSASAIANSNINHSTTKKATSSTTLAALFGGPSIGSVGNYSNLNNLAAAQHDYTLVGDSPYETTYDPQSAFYYNRVYGQLYITTISVMFRGKAFGPIGAIPYERRLLLPFLEISEIQAYKTTSVKITMNDGESYVFKSFANREAMVKLLKRTKKKCHETHKQRRHTTSIVSALPTSSESTSIPKQNNSNNNNIITPIANNRSSLVESTILPREHRRSRTPNPTDKKHNNNNHSKDVRRRSQSMPSSLRPSKTARASSKSLTPQRNSVFFYETGHPNNKENADVFPKTPKTNEARTPRSSKPVPVGSLSLSLREDGKEALEKTTTSSSTNQQQPNDFNRPRRLFEMEPSAMVAANATAAAVMLSPPRTRISQRKQPKTPQVASVNETPTNTKSNSTASNNNVITAKIQQKRDKSGKNMTGGTLASIPSIPTVPSLNTPELSSQKRVIKIEESRVARGSAIPLPIPEIAHDDSSPIEGVAPRVLAPVTPIGNHSPAPSAQDILVEKAWKAAILPSNKNQKDWTVAMEPTKLPNCTLDEWFDLFFSDDAFFSLARYQLEHVGDRDVSFHPWRKCSKKSGGEEKKMETQTEAEIPELEREIKYIHPIGGSMIGPSEAETFRVQSLKRYANHGAILKNTTTVGKGIPMGDCFRVEDQWIIEKDPSEFNLTISVTFKVVFVKRTMFKGMIQKNTLSETQEWFKGYSKMLQAALGSPQHHELIQKRHPKIPEELDSNSPSSSAPSLSLSRRESSAKNSGEMAKGSSHDYGEFTHSPQSSSSVTATSDGQFSAAKPAEHHAALDKRFNTSGVLVWMGALGLMLLLLLAVVALWMQVQSMTKSLSLVEGTLGELKAQNTMLLQKLEELATNSAGGDGGSGTEPATLLSATTT